MSIKLFLHKWNPTRFLDREMQITSVLIVMIPLLVLSVSANVVLA